MKRAMTRALVTAGAISALLLAPAPAGADPSDTAASVAKEVMSPFCPGVTLHDCPSSEADEMRLDIQEMADAGMSKGDILDRLEAEFGPSIRATPPASGRGLLAWLLPGLAVAGGVGVVVWLLPKLSSRGPDEPEGTPRPGTDARLAAELEEFREAQFGPESPS